MRKRSRLSLVAISLLLMGLGVLVQIPYWSARLLEHGLRSYFHRDATVASVRYRIMPFEVEVTGLVVEGSKPGVAALEVPRAVIVPSLESPRVGRIHIRLLRLENPVVRIHAFRDPPYGPGGDDLPALGSRGGTGPTVRIGRLVVTHGALELEHDRVPLDLDLPAFRLRLAEGARRGLEGRLLFDEGALRIGNGPTLPVGADIALRVDGPIIYVDEGHVRAPGTDLELRGRLSLRGRPQGQFAIQGPLDLETLDRHVIQSRLRMMADARWDGALLVDGPLLRFEGHLRGEAGRFDGLPIERFAGDLAWDRGGAELRGLEISALGGTARLDVDIPAGARPVRVAGALAAVDTEGLLSWVFTMGRPGIAAAATGDIDLSWPKKSPRLISGRIAVDLAPLEGSRSPLSGRFEWSALDGDQRIGLADLRSTRSHVRLQGRIAPDDKVDVAVAAESQSLEETDGLLTSLRVALGSEEARPAGIGGAGSFIGRWGGSLDAPEFTGRFGGGDVRWSGVSWGRAEWAGTVSTSSVLSRSLVLRRKDATLWLDGRTGLGPFGEDDVLDARVRLTAWPAEDLVAALGFRLDVRGALSGQVTLRGTRSRPEGQSTLRLTSGTYSKIPVESADVDVRWGEGRTRIAKGEASLGGGTARFAGTLSDDGVWDGEASLENVEIEGLFPPLPDPVRPAGRVSGRVALLGTLVRPRLRARLTSPRLFLGEEGLGALEASLLGTGDGAVRVDARCRSARMDLTLGGTVGAAAPYESALRLDAREASLDPFLRALWPALPPSIGLVASGRAEVQGPLERPGDVTARASFPGLVLNLPEYTIRAPEPIVAELRAGRLLLQSFHLAGEGTDLQIEGTLGLPGGGGHAVTAKGTADLRAFSAFSRTVRGRGAARLSLRLTGTTADPRVEGDLQIAGGGLRLRGFPHGLEDVEAQIAFTERSAEIRAMTATLAGGPVELRGQLTYAGGRLTGMELRPTGRNLALRYPEGLRSVVDVDLRVFGDDEGQWITGTVDVQQALWSRRYDLASELLAGARPTPLRGSFDDTVHLDLKVRAPGTLRVDNNLASLTAPADLTLQGTPSAPVVMGRAEIDRGRVYFQGQTYLIRRGTVDFASPDRIDPLFDIEAETRVRSYNVTLAVNGSLGRMTPTLSSDPPLSALQILNLLAGADESVVTSLAQAQIGQARLAATGAATLAAGRLSEQVGLERGAEKVLGLNRFSIDPTLLRGSGTTPTARLTVGKRLTPDLSVLYTQDLRGTEERIISLEYSLSNRFSILLERADPDGLAFDVRLRHHR